MTFQAFLIRLRILLANRASRLANEAKRNANFAKVVLVERFEEQRRQQTANAWEAASDAADFAVEMQETERQDVAAFRDSI